MDKKTVAILAPTGMLGSMVYNEFKDRYKLVLVYRGEEKLKILNEVYGGVNKHELVQADFADIYLDYQNGFSKDSISPKVKELFETIGNVDTVINCAGMIKQKVIKDPGLMLFVNGAVPNILSSYYGEKLIQITTDCAYSGIVGFPYDENSPKDPNDLYGLSKSIGEPSLKSLVLRTSIVGPELAEGVSLLGWFLKQEGQTVKGFSTHLWNGITTKEFARVCGKIIDSRSEFPKNGLYHIFSNDVTKLEMLKVFQKKYGTNVKIEEMAPPTVDRRLRTVYDLCKKLEVPSFEQMINQL